MSNYSSLKATINANVKQNGNQEITGVIMNSVLNAMVDSLGAGYQYKGVATPATNPGTPDYNVFYLASEAGTYTNFGGLVIGDNEVAALVYNGSWSKQTTGAATASEVSQLAQNVTPSKASFVGNNNTFVWQTSAILAKPGRVYRLIPFVKEWAHSSVSSTANFIALGYTIGGVNTTLATCAGWAFRDYYDVAIPFTVADGAYLLVGGRANLGVNVEFAVYDVTDVVRLAPQVEGINLTGAVAFTGNQERLAFYQIFIPKGTPFSLKVSSASISWTRLGVVANDTWARGTILKDNVVNGTVYNIASAPVDITSIYVYVISGFSGSGNIDIEVKYDGLEQKVESLEDDLASMFTEVFGKNLLDTSAVTTKRWIAQNGSLDTVTADYGASDYIPVTPGQAYHLSNKNGVALSNRSDAYIAFYNSSKVSLGSAFSVASNTTDVTAPADAAFMRVSLTMDRVTNLDAQIEKGTVRTSYAEYVSPVEAIRPELIKLPEDAVDTENVKDGAITRNKIADGVSLPASPRQFGSVSLTETTLSPGEKSQTDYYAVSKNVTLVALIKGAVESISVGRSHNGANGEWVEVTPTQVKTRYGTSGTVNQTFNHGLTLGTRTIVIIDKTVNKDSQASATIRIINDYGDIFSQSVTWWGSIMGRAFVLNGNASGNIDASLSFFLRDITKAIWMFGDSYFNYDGNTRWPYYPIKWGFDNFLLNGRGGENASEAFSEFQALLNFGIIPSYAVWCMGMNSGADTSGAVNPTWLSMTQSFITLCEANGIQPILATIPSVPTEIHTKLNEWVRASGYRYIDFAEAVENGVDYYWRGWGTSNALLSNDEVHPTARGAAELACRALQDFPEMTVLYN